VCATAKALITTKPAHLAKVLKKLNADYATELVNAAAAKGRGRFRENCGGSPHFRRKV